MVTIFTPTFNRGYIIERLYQSLKRQTCKDFEWIVIDDGSTDNTEKKIQKWIQERNSFVIKYKKVKNGGKHRAINIGVNMAHSEFFFIVDSDDYLTEDAIKKVHGWINSICNDPAFAGVSGLKGFSTESPIGGWGKFTNSYIDATNLERERYGLLKDKAEIYKTSVLKSYPFPEFENENFLTEAIVFNKIAQAGYKLRWFKEVIYICEYLPDGLTKCGYSKSIKNPQGYMAYLNLLAEIYGEQYGDTLKFGFYFVLRGDNDIMKCKEIMGIASKKTYIFEQRYEEMIKSMNHYFEEHNWTNIAIYGYGNVGNAFLSCKELLDVNIKYIIDRNPINKGEIKTYCLKDNLEEVDAVIITLLNYDLNLENKIKELFSTVVYWKDISSNYWVR